MGLSARKGDTGDTRAGRAVADYRQVGALVVRRAHLAVATHTMMVDAMRQPAGTTSAAEAAQGVACKGARP